LADWLGSERVRTSITGAQVENCTSLPFGDAQTCTGTDESPLHFTGGQWDWESNLTSFWFRSYSTTQGRWLTMDPAGLAAVDITNPQTWNRYAYVANNPLSFTDPTGKNMKGPGECQGGEGLCSWEGGGANPSSIGGGGFGAGIDANGIPWNFGPGYVMQANSTIAWIQTSEAAYLAQVDQAFANVWQYRLLATSDCPIDPQDREIKYQLVNLNGTAQTNYYVVQHESNPDRVAGSDFSFGSQTTYDENGAFDDSLRAAPAIFGSSNSIQTFFMSPMNKPKSAGNMTSVLVRDGGGNDYSKLGAWMSFNQILMNGKPAPSLAACPK
jgi:RHS repeat-associated protein